MSALAAACVAGAQTVKLTPVPSGFMPMEGGYMPQQLHLADKTPNGVKKLPVGLTNAKFGELALGGKEFIVCVGDLPGKPAQLFVDTNGNGDLTDDPAPTWSKRAYKQRDGTARQISMGSALVGFHLAGSKAPVNMGFYTFDRLDAERPTLKDVLLYYPDYGYKGEVKLGAKSYPFLLTDDLATGNIKGSTGARSGVRLMIDRDGSGKFAQNGKVFDSHKPFNIDGVTYDIAQVSPDGATVSFEVSKTTVAEIPLPLTFKVGSTFPGFKATMMDKSDVSFPSAYKGHIVMLDFWATWCGPCMGEVPNITATYEKYHDKGFDILGVSLDQKDQSQKVIDVTKSKNMSWPQIYDGGYWQAAIAVKYGIESIPHAFLVDGDTGELLAEGDSLRGEEIAKVIEQALEKKGLLKAKAK